DLDHVRGYGETLRMLRQNDVAVREFWSPPLLGRWAKAVSQTCTLPKTDQYLSELVQLATEMEWIEVRRELQCLPANTPTLYSQFRPHVGIEFIAPSHVFRERFTVHDLLSAVHPSAIVSRLVGGVSDANLLSAGFRVRFGKCRLL